MKKMTNPETAGRFLPFYLFTFLLILSLFSCETDSYEKGEGEYSLMQADFAELTVNATKQAVAFTTDDGDTYQLTVPFTAKWMQTADTTYRAIVYYNKVSEGQAEPMAAGTVLTLLPIEHWRYKVLPQDPVGLESAWLARKGKYLNLGLLVKSAYIDDEEPVQQIGLAQDTVYVRDDGRRTACYRLLHNQNDIPEYYTNRRYVSILLPNERPDTVRLVINTYDGVKEKTFIP